MDKIRAAKLAGFMDKLQIPYANLDLINQAFFHSSMSHRGETSQSNERLEFLGDTVLSMCVSEYLYRKFPQAAEGKLTRMRSYLVSEKMLSDLARKIHLEELLLLSWGEENSGGRSRDANLADAFEAFLAALFLDSGVETAKNFILGIIKDEIEKVSDDAFIFDYKTEFQYIIQQKYKKCPEYRVALEEGPPHHRTFVSELVMNGAVLSRGTGLSKKKAEQEAARIAMELLKSGQIQL